MLGIMILTALVGQTLTWAKAYDRYFAPGIDTTSYNDTVYAIACDTFGGDLNPDAYVVVGHTDQGPLGGLDVLVTKLNAFDGSVIWTRAYGYPFMVENDDYGRAVIVDHDTSGTYYVVTGYSKPGMGYSNSDVLVFKVNAIDGSLVWGWVYSGFWFLEPDWVMTDDYAYDIVRDGKDYLIAGNVEDYLYGAPCWGNSDVLVFSVNAATGFVNWAMTYGKFYLDHGGMDEYAYSIIEDSTTTPCSLFVVAGRSVHSYEGYPLQDILVFKGMKDWGWIDPVTWWIYDYDIYGTECAYCIKNDHIPGYILCGDIDTSIVVMRLNPNLSVGWGGTCRVYNIQNTSSSRYIKPTTDQNYVFTGFTAPGIPGPVDLLVTKIDQTGNVMWSKALAGCQNFGTWMTLPDYGQCIRECRPDTYVVAGYTDWPLPSTWIPTNLLVAKMNVMGNIPCPIGDTCMLDIETISLDNLVDIDTCAIQYPIMMEIDSIADSTVKIRDKVICSSTGMALEEGSSTMSIYGVFSFPNPFTAETRISYILNNGCYVEVNIYDVSGRLVSTLVDEDRLAGEHSIVWNGRDKKGDRLAPGVYFFLIQVGNHTETGKMILIK